MAKFKDEKRAKETLKERKRMEAAFRSMIVERAGSLMQARLTGVVTGVNVETLTKECVALVIANYVEGDTCDLQAIPFFRSPSAEEDGDLGDDDRPSGLVIAKALPPL
jgi:hypothetical protein